MAAIAARLGLGNDWRHYAGMPEQTGHGRGVSGAVHGSTDGGQSQRGRGPPPPMPLGSEAPLPDAGMLPPGLLQLLNQDTAADASAGLQQVISPLTSTRLVFCLKCLPATFLLERSTLLSSSPTVVPSACAQHAPVDSDD